MIFSWREVLFTTSNFYNSKSFFITNLQKNYRWGLLHPPMQDIYLKFSIFLKLSISLKLIFFKFLIFETFNIFKIWKSFKMQKFSLIAKTLWAPLMSCELGKRPPLPPSHRAFDYNPHFFELPCFFFFCKISQFNYHFF